jgi:hypothetical protein
MVADVRSQAEAQIADIRSTGGNGSAAPADVLDDATAAAAEEAAEMAADVEAKAARVKKAAKDEASAAE